MRKLQSTNYKHQNALAADCGLTYAMLLLSGRWKINILWMIKNGVNRYVLLKSKIAGISEKMLTERLKELESLGLIHRFDFQTIPPHVEYSLSEAGLLLSPILETLTEWGNQIRPIIDKQI